MFRILWAGSLCVLCSLAHGQWQPTNGPIGLAVNHLAIQDSVLFAETNLGIYASKDHGALWEALPPDGGNGYRSGIVAHQGALYAGSNGGLFRYDEKAGTWSRSNSTLTDTTIGCLASFGGKLLIGDKSGEIFTTVDQGLHWAKIFSDSAAWPVSVLAVDSNAIYARVNDRFIHSLDNGAHWITSTTKFLDGAPFNSIVTSANFVFTQSGAAILRSSDFGGTWKTVFAGKDSTWITCLSKAGGFLFASLQGNAEQIWTYRSADNGETWTDITHFFTLNQGVQVYQMDRLGGDLFAATFQGVFRSRDNGVNWSQMAKGISSIPFKSLVGFPNGDWVGLSNWGFFQSHDLGENWIRFADTSASIQLRSFQFLFPKDGLIYATMDYPGLYQSADEGRNWALVNASVPPAIAQEFASMGPDLYLASGTEGVQKSSDQGKTWASVSKGLPAKSEGVLVVCDGILFFSNYTSLYRYQPIAGTWESLPPSPGLDQTDFFSDGTTLYMHDRYGPSYRSIDDGLTWSLMNHGFDSLVILCALSSGGHVFAGTRYDSERLTRLADSKDRGATWSAINDGLPNEDVNSLLIQGDYLIAVTGFGVWKRPLKELGVVGIQSQGLKRTHSGNPVRARFNHGRMEWILQAESSSPILKFDGRGKRLPPNQRPGVE